MNGADVGMVGTKVNKAVLLCAEAQSRVLTFDKVQEMVQHILESDLATTISTLVDIINELSVEKDNVFYLYKQICKEQAKVDVDARIIELKKDMSRRELEYGDSIANMREREYKIGQLENEIKRLESELFLSEQAVDKLKHELAMSYTMQEHERSILQTKDEDYECECEST
jgi:HAMP domain-containing protein